MRSVITLVAAMSASPGRQLQPPSSPSRRHRRSSRVQACVDTSNVVHATATWSKTAVTHIQFWVSGYHPLLGGRMALGEQIVFLPTPERNGSVSVSLLPEGSVLNGIPVDTIQVNFYSPKGGPRWLASWLWRLAQRREGSVRPVLEGGRFHYPDNTAGDAGSSLVRPDRQRRSG